MLKFVSLLLCALFIGFSAPGCTKKKTVAEITAERNRLEKIKRKNESIKLYESLIAKYPDSEHAAEARARLQAMGPALGQDGKPMPPPKK